MIIFFSNIIRSRRSGQTAPETPFTLPADKPGQVAYLVSYGDSIASGAYVGGDENTYGAKVAELINKSYDIEGYSSQTVDYLFANVNSKIVAKDPTFCIVEGGINDVHAGIATSNIIDDKIGIITACVSNNIIPIVLPILSYFNLTSEKVIAIQEVNDAVLEYCTTNNLIHVDPRPELCEDDPEYYDGNLLTLKGIYQGDILHPNEAGHAVISNSIYQKLQEIY
jgi:lysophospholipase L1-like esterase